MKRAYLALIGASLAAAVALAVLARVPQPRDTARVEPVHQQVDVRLTVDHGTVTPGVSTVRKGLVIRLAVLNRGTSAIRFALSGYEERVSVSGIAPDSTWRTEFLADRPGDEFEWLVDGRAAGRFIVLGSHLEEGHE